MADTKTIKRTAAQEAAVTARGRSLMISAAAGSGKTATLTQRIVSLITDKDNPADISSMLIVTFTRKAAGELRQRITDAINRALIDDPTNKHLSRQLTSVGGADICTIDSYYLSLARENFQRLGLPASFRMADPAETSVIAREIADKLIEHKYDTDPDFAHLADTLTPTKGEGALADIITELASRVASLERGPASLVDSAVLFKDEAKADFFDSRTGKILKSGIIRSLKNAQEDLEHAIGLVGSDPDFAKYLPTLEDDLRQVAKILSKFESGAKYDEIRASVMEYVPARIGVAAKGADEETKASIKDDRDNAKGLLCDLKETTFAMSASEISVAMVETANLLEELCAVLSDFERSFREAKNARMIADFADLARYASALLEGENGEPSDIALAEQSKYTHIFVDEYQDTDGRQDKIFNLISRGDNLFIVGDIKQSIYSFRGARPSVFSSYRGKWAPIAETTPPDPAAIYMSENFRCSEKVIDFTNTVCEKLFEEGEKNSRPGCGIGYRREDNLIFKGDIPRSVPVEIIACEGVPKSDDEGENDKLTAEDKNGRNNEIRVVVETIKSIAERRQQNPDGTRPYQDIAVLARNSKYLSLVAEALTAEGVPFSNNADTDLFENPEVILFHSVLQSIDNPMKDTPLAGALRSPIFGFTLTDLVNVKLGKHNYPLYDAVKAYAGDEESEPELRGKCTRALEKLAFWRAQSEELPIDRFIRFLWKETGADGYSGSDPAGAKQKPAERQSNMRTLYEYARSYSSSGFKTLHDFVSFVSDILADGSSIAIPPAPSIGAVSLMTVHKSKGLEFPCVILCGTSGQFNKMDSRSSLVYTDTNGIGPISKLTDPKGLCIEDTPMRQAVSELISDLSTEEEIRILYVALTRAKYELYITGNGADGFFDKLKDKAYKAHRRTSSRILQTGKNWFEWIIYALAGLDAKKDGGFFTFTVIPSPTPDVRQAEGPSLAEADRDIGAEQALEEQKAADFDAKVEAAYQKMRSAIDECYAYDKEAAIPAKLSVSALYPDLITDAEKEETAVLIDKTKDKTPRFMGGEEAGATDKGTATHLFMQFCDFPALGTAADTESEIARLVERGFIPPKTAELIRKDEITRFASSSFYKTLIASKNIERERRFNILLPAADFTTDMLLRDKLKDETVLVQGVIDVFFEDENGKLVLCDYKTDRLPKTCKSADEVAALMKERHGEQLRYYCAAIERLCGRKPDRVCVFPLAFGEAVDIDISK